MTTDWQHRGGMVNAGIQLAPMDLNKEHVFELMSVEIQEGVTTKYGIKNKVKMVWKEADKDKEYHRVWTNFNESYNEKAALVQFIAKISPRPIVPGTPVMLGDYIALGMRIKSMVQPRIDKEKGLPSGYYDFMPASIKPAGALSMPKNPSEVTPEWRAAISQFAKGAKSAGDAWGLLMGKVPTEYIQAFVAADKRGEITYPIQ